MTVPLRLRGIIPAVYGRSFHSLRALGPATAAAFVVLLAGDVADAMMGTSNGVATQTSWSLLLHVAVAVLIAPFKVMLYEVMWGAEAKIWPAFRARHRSILNLIALDVPFLLAAAAWAWLWKIHSSFGVPTVAVLALIVPMWWIRVRLVLMGPVLALEALPFSVADAISATNGRVWKITLAELLVGAAILPAAVVLMLVAFWMQKVSLTWSLSRAILMSPLSVLSVATGIGIQAELFRRLGLPSAVDAGPPVPA